jgi:hypothetical protein
MTRTSILRVALLVGLIPAALSAQSPAPKGKKITSEDRAYWAYRPLTRPEPPRVKNSAWVRNPIDAFVLAKLEDKGLTPAAPADRVALCRRVYFDLTGLPATPEQIDAFVNDQDPSAYEKLLDRLLDSPPYGEKWGRHWLDLVRYAETHGYERDLPKPFAWRYRDYVIDSFNQDKPYDQFIREQIAGDELDTVTPETMTATGYYRLGIWDDEPADRLLAKYDVLDGIVSTTGQVFLGTTIGCARCHDHKKDPVPQRDYYRMLAFFRDVTDMNVKNTRMVMTARDRAEAERLTKERQAREAKLYHQIYQLEQRFIAEAAKKGMPTSRLVSSDMTDLRYRYYLDTWDHLPEFDTIMPEAAGEVAHNFFSLSPASRSDAIGLVFEGKLRVPEKGTYTFFLESTDGARLTVDGKPILDKPAKGRQRGEAKAELAAGLVPIRLDYFNTAGKPLLKVDWAGPGVPRRALTTREDLPARVVLPDSRVEPQTWAYNFRTPEPDWVTPEYDVTGWKTGPGGFGTQGTPGAVVRTAWKSDDIWLRRTFQVDELPAGLTLTLHHDDDVEVYLNGKRVYQAKGYLVEYRPYVLGPDALQALKKGTNVIAVHCHQTTGGQYIDVGLVETSDAANLPELIRRHGADVLGPEETQGYAELTRLLDQSRKAPPPDVGIEVMCVQESGRSPAHLLIRGLPSAPGEQVTAGVPEVLAEKPIDVPQRDPSSPSSGKRRVLADWLARKDNPLTARVMANRMWQHHFGRGIVPTSNDFGKLGEGATHPELLDWLASELMDGGWKLKRMHKLIMTSNAYRMSSKGDPKALAVDGANALLWRFNMRRLTAEEVRDSILAVTGKLNLKAGGPSVYPPIPKEVLAGQSVPGQGWPTSPAAAACRRSVYVHVKRSLQVPILAHHDQADTDSSCAVRYTTTVPTTALGMLNGAFTNEQAAAFAERLRRERPNDLTEQVRRAIRLTTGRVPGEEEVRKDVAFVREMQVKAKLSEVEALTRYCLLALNTNEFVYLD